MNDMDVMNENISNGISSNSESDGLPGVFGNLSGSQLNNTGNNNENSNDGIILSFHVFAF